MSPTVAHAIDAPVADPRLLAKYAFHPPRYRSYPSADRFGGRYRAADARQRLRELPDEGDAGALSLYVHIPFCESACRTCDRVTVVTGERGRAREYLAYLEREIATQRGTIGSDREVAEVRLGGGTPTFLTVEEISRLMETLRGYFRLLPEGDYGIEADPRRLSAHDVERLAAIGFNRLSIGLMDLDPGVQEQIGRRQSLEDTAGALLAARRSGFRSVQLGLACPLPGQSVRTMAATTAAVAQLRPDRVLLQRRRGTPERGADAEILAQAIEGLLAAGYLYLGMDLFALPGDDLALAQARGELRLDLRGYATRSSGAELSFGLAAISAVGDAYGRNHLSLADYYASLERGDLPVGSGHCLDADDLARREVIRQLACRGEIDYADLAARAGIDFPRDFRAEQLRLEQFAQEGLLEMTDDGLRVLPRGRLLVGALCLAFDRYAGAPAGQVRVAAGA